MKRSNHKKPKKVQLEYLIERFDRIDRRFDAVDQRFDQFAVAVKQGFDAVDKRFKDLEQRMDQRFDLVEHRLERVELRLNECAYRFEFNELSQRVAVLEQKRHTPR